MSIDLGVLEIQGFAFAWGLDGLAPIPGLAGGVVAGVESRVLLRGARDRHWRGRHWRDEEDERVTYTPRQN